MTPVTTGPLRLEPFERQAVEVLGRLRAAVSSAIAAMPGTRVRRAADLQKAAKIDVKLSWRLFKVARAANPLAAGPYVPGPSNIRTFVQAAHRAGVAEDVLQAVEQASQDFERFVVAHAGDRDAFNSMVSTLSRGGDADQTNLQQRRAAFRANRHLWGVQATTQAKLVFTNIGDDPGRVSVAVVDGYVALRQLRREAPLFITTTRAADDHGKPLPVVRQPIDTRAVTQHGLALLQDFCSEPTPELREVPAAAGFVCGELVSQGVGNGGAITCFTGWKAANVASRFRAPGNEFAITHGTVRTPCEAVTVCLLTRAGMFGAAEPELALYSDHLAELPYPVHTHRMDKLLLADENVTYLGRGANSLYSPDIPRLNELAQYVFHELKWDGEQFDVWRCRIAYPVLPSTVAIRVELPEPGTK